VPNSLPTRSKREPAYSACDAELTHTLLTLCDDALTHHRAGRFAEAISRYERVLSLGLDTPHIHNNLGHALGALGKPEAAAIALQRAIEHKPDYADALCNFGLALANLERFDEAEAKYQQAIRANPRHAGTYNNLGILLKEKGRFIEARQAFERAIDLAPRNFAYYDNLAAVRPFVAGDPYLSALETAVDDSAALPIAEQIHVNFALAKAYDGLHRPERAFRHLLKANRLKREQIAYDEADTLGRMNRLRELISSDFIQARRGCGAPSSGPVFIIGMTRSGTTLIEQILASHPQIFGAGELLLLDQLAGSIRDQLPGVPAFPEMMLEMSPEHFHKLGMLYTDRIGQRAPSAKRITDKMTTNFLFAGLIHLALPNATIIHAVRDPLDTCVSCFATHFTSGHEHTYDLAELGRYYGHYRKLMAHWHEVLPPNRILDVHYEELVNDVEGVARRIVAHCGLDWDAHCLDFHRNERPIRTASAVQVRRPIYRESVGRRQKYQDFLGPLLAEFAPPPATAHGERTRGSEWRYADVEAPQQ
jgi:tetratricopeptide (TPR) repeat protein